MWEQHAYHGGLTIQQLVVGDDNESVHRGPQRLNGVCSLQATWKVYNMTIRMWVMGSKTLEMSGPVSSLQHILLAHASTSSNIWLSLNMGQHQLEWFGSSQGKSCVY